MGQTLQPGVTVPQMHSLVLQRLKAAVRAGVVKSAEGGGVCNAQLRARAATPSLGRGLCFLRWLTTESSRSGTVIDDEYQRVPSR